MLNIAIRLSFKNIQRNEIMEIKVQRALPTDQFTCGLLLFTLFVLLLQLSCLCQEILPQ